MSARQRLAMLDSGTIVCMPARQFRTALALAEYLGDNTSGAVKVDALAAIMRRSRRTATIGLRELERAGIISVQRRSGSPSVVVVIAPNPRSSLRG